MAAKLESADKVLRRYKREFLLNELLLISGNALNSGLTLHDVKNVCRKSASVNSKYFDHQHSKHWRSNCYQPLLNEMRQHYSRPHFLPADAEHAHVDYVFMGYQQGAVMHLDYISRLMWQAQLRGHKTWRLNPPPECEAVCSGFSFRVYPGDILLLDTRQWYHDTHIDEGEFSLTVSSEYG
ncbi:uncharacterized protein LOC111047797 isoform X2 [Nilaparvata lugens]|uniref:uncharacterized protein LOC111047797 isoform X2 n=1 Tax=Nilaparvata lugens TaxID=108931 RepID=UPI00193DEB31|nr:uncharacterized protein LOC111047797 isoform X2 [Nilaparvata lugens]